MSATHKITTVLPDATYKRIKRLIPWGLRKHLMTGVIETVLDAVEQHGEVVVGALMSGKFRLEWEPADNARNLSNRSEEK